MLTPRFLSVGSVCLTVKRKQQEAMSIVDGKKAQKQQLRLKPMYNQTYQAEM